MNYDTIVVGGGHAGCEASLASSRLGKKTLLVTGNIKNIADMPCNPSIGGPAKGIVVREIDALGGEMARNTDKSFLQMKMLNTKKGPAVRALRAQADKITYRKEMLKTLENQENLIYINILDLILKVIMIYIVIIGITSSMNIISASICEREFEFEALNNIGATKKQINKILVYECIYIFAYSLILSIILSIPILYLIIRHMKSVIIFNNLLIPFKSICLFFTFLFLISLGISIYLIKTIKK